MPKFKWTASVVAPVGDGTVRGSGSGTAEADSKAEAERDVTRHVRKQVCGSTNIVTVTVTEA
jgi:hypothetical protein